MSIIVFKAVKSTWLVGIVWISHLNWVDSPNKRTLSPKATTWRKLMGLGRLAELTVLHLEAESLRERSSVVSSMRRYLRSPPVTRSTWGMTSYSLCDQLITITLSVPETKLLHPWPYLPTSRGARSLSQPSWLYSDTLFLVQKPPVRITLSSRGMLQAVLKSFYKENVKLSIIHVYLVSYFILKVFSLVSLVTNSVVYPSLSPPNRKVPPPEPGGDHELWRYLCWVREKGSLTQSPSPALHLRQLLMTEEAQPPHIMLPDWVWYILESGSEGNLHQCKLFKQPN